MKYPERIKIDLNILKDERILEKGEAFFMKNATNFLKKKKFVYLSKCPCCKSKKINFLIKKKKINFYICNLGTIFMNPIPRAEDINAIYKLNDLYSSHRKKIITSKSLILRKNSNKRKAKQIAYFLKNKESFILDYGSGNISLLEECKKIKYKNLFAYDLNFKKNELIKDIYLSNNIFKNKKKFDAVTLWGVLEHMTNPYDNLKKIRSLLCKKGSLIILDIPSSDSLLSHAIFNSNFLTNRYLEPYRHLTFFSKNFVHHICKNLDLKLLLLETNGLDVQTIFKSKNIKINNFLINKQIKIDRLGLGDHYRVFLKVN